MPVLTVGHELHDEPWVGDVGAAHLRAAHALAHLRHYTRHLVCGEGGTTLLVGTGNSNENEMGPLVGGETGGPDSRILGREWEAGTWILAQERVWMGHRQDSVGAGVHKLPGYRMRLIIPGMTIRNMGSSFK